MPASIVSYGFEDGSFFRSFDGAKTRLEGKKFAVCFDATDWTLNAHGSAKDVRDRAEALLSNYKKLGMLDYVQALRIMEFDESYPALQETLSILNKSLGGFALNGMFANMILRDDRAKPFISAFVDAPQAKPVLEKTTPANPSPAPAKAAPTIEAPRQTAAVKQDKPASDAKPKKNQANISSFLFG